MGLLSRLATTTAHPAQGDFASQPWAVVDVETTGFQPGSHRVLSVAALALDEHGRVERQFTTLLDPGCDPGPVHIHGLTRERLAGAPRFDDVFGPLSAILDGRVLVAHNAVFDYGFLAAECRRAGVALATSQRLCTVALSRRLGIPTQDHKLATLANYWQVPHAHQHDALEDARALVGVFVHSRALAQKLGLPLPVTECHGYTGYLSNAVPRVACAWVYAGRWSGSGPLVQGMKVAITGTTRQPREALAAAATRAGLDVMNNVSGRTAVLVSNDPGEGSSKLLVARQHQVPVISESELQALLLSVTPGTPKQVAQTLSAKAVVLTPSGPLAGQRLLVLGGPHDAAAAVRAKVVADGGTVATNLTLSITAVVLLSGAERDPRVARARERSLPLLNADLSPLSAPAKPVEVLPTGLEAVSAAPALSRGQVLDLPDEGPWTVNVSWVVEGLRPGVDVDVVAFRVGADERVLEDEDLVFFNQPMAGDGAVALSVDGSAEQSIRVDLAMLDSDYARVVVAAALPDGVSFRHLGAVELSIDGEAGVFATSTLDAATTEQTLVLAEFYRRGDAWRLRAVGQGYDTGLAALCELYGVAVS